MSDQIIINVTPDPAILIDAIDHQEEIALNPVTLNQGLIDHAVTHISGGSDELFHNSLRNQGGKNGEYYHLTLEQYNNIIYQTGSGSFATQGFVTGISGDLQQQISNLDSETGSYVLKSQTGAFYPSSNPSGFITGVDLTPYATTGYVTGISGALQQQVNILQGQTGSYTLHSETGAFYPSSNPSGFITGAPNLSGYATESYVTGISGGLQQQITKLDNQTGNYTLHSETGVFYPRTNPSGYITGVDLSATGSFLTTGSADSLYVSLTSSQTISGAKAFDQRPTVFGTGVMLSGEVAQLPTTLVYTTGDQDISGIKTFASGIPLLNASLSDFYNNQQIVDKEYVDSRTMGGNKSWFFTKDASNVSGLYNATITFPNASGQEIASSAHNGESTIAQFLTEPQSRPYTVLDGMRFFHLTAKVSSVSKTTQLRGEVWTCDATGGSQSLLRTSALSIPLAIANAEYETSVYGGSLYIPTSTRIIFKIISVRASGGGSPTVTLSVNDNTFSRLDVPSPVGVTDTSTLLKLDQTTNPQTIIGPLSVGGNIWASGDLNVSGASHFYLRPTVSGTGVLLSGEIPPLPTTLVYATGNQDISGVKNFYSRPTVNGTGVLLTSETGSFVISSQTGSFLTTGSADNRYVALTGNQNISGLKTFLTGVNVSGNLSVSGGLSATTFLSPPRYTSAEITGISGSINGSVIYNTTQGNLNTYNSGLSGWETIVDSDYVTNVSTLTQAQYDALSGGPVATTMYIITDANTLGSVTSNIVNTTTNYILGTTDCTLNVTANSITVSLPYVANIVGRHYYVKNCGTGVVTLTGYSGDLIDDSSYYLLYQKNQSVHVQSAGIGWVIL